MSNSVTGQGEIIQDMLASHASANRDLLVRFSRL